MRNPGGGAMVVAGCVAAACVAAASPPPGYELAWSDEFDGPGIDTNEWNHREGKAHLSRCDRKWVSVANGAMRIELAPDGDAFSGGGLITRRRYRAGYFEVAARMDGGPGWHEAFWTTWASGTADLSAKAYLDRPRIEIDCFEQYGTLESNRFSFGSIQWYPLRGSIGRAVHTARDDLSAGFHVYGFEVDADYVAYHFDGQWTGTDDLRGAEQSEFALWLTCIATRPDAQAKNGGMLFDYLRCYALDPARRAERRAAVLAHWAAAGGVALASTGTDLWIEAEDFAERASWRVARDGPLVLEGLAKKGPSSEAECTARTTVEVAKPGAYRLWVRARDFKIASPGRRSFAVAVNGMRARPLFGTHGQEGYAWQDGGTFDLVAGPVAIELADTSRYYARCDRLLLTTDPAFTPAGRGGLPNVVHSRSDKPGGAREP